MSRSSSHVSSPPLDAVPQPAPFAPSGSGSTNFFTQSGYIPTLDGWRAVAILFVSIDHSNLLPYASTSARHWISSGFMGVWVFFAISGLLICTRLLNEEGRTGKISLRSFFLRRLTRIQPAALVFLVVSLLLFAAHQIPLHPWSFLGATFQFEDYVDYVFGPEGGSWYSRHFWSLSVEEHFYLLLPFCLLWAKRYRLRLFAAATTSLFVWSVIGSRIAAHHQREFLHRTDLILPGLLIPATFAILLRRPGLATRTPAWLAWVCVALTALLIQHSDHVHIWQLDAVYPILFSAMIVSTVQNPSSLLSRFLELPAIRFLGRLSFSFYLYQQLFFVAIFPRSPGWLGAFQRFPLDYLCSFALAIASYYVVEKPFIRWGHRLTQRKTSPHGANALQTATS